MKLFIILISALVLSMTKYIDPNDKLTFDVIGIYKSETIYEPSINQEFQTLLVYQAEKMGLQKSKNFKYIINYAISSKEDFQFLEYSAETVFEKKEFKNFRADFVEIEQRDNNGDINKVLILNYMGNNGEKLNFMLMTDLKLYNYYREDIFNLINSMKINF